MLSRFICRPLRIRSLTLTLISSSNPITTTLSSTSHFSLNPTRTIFPFVEPSRSLSSKNPRDAGNDAGVWKFTPEEPDGDIDAVFGKSEQGGNAGAIPAVGSGGVTGRDSWAAEGKEGDIFEKIDKDFESKRGEDGDGEWATAEGYEPWGFGDEEGEEEEGKEKEKTEEEFRLEEEEKELLTTLKGPNRAFGDLIAASGITEEMLDSLILLKDLKGVQGLPSLREIEDMRLAKDAAPSVRAEVERKKQEEVAKARVRQVDEKGRAYGTGRRKCSIARVWIQPGDGKFIVNDKQFDVYFPIIDHRADLLRPFTATKTLGLWDVNCTVKGGGVSGQVGAVRLGISRALQNWEPGLRPYLRSVGFLTRDSRIVERKKPGKAKARKSFQWVKR